MFVCYYLIMIWKKNHDIIIIIKHICKIIELTGIDYTIADAMNNYFDLQADIESDQ